MRRLRALAVCFLLFGSSAGLWADSLAGYTRHVWQAPDGLPEQTVQAFAQTGDGYLWIGTTGGLLRFDGAHFTLFDRQNTPALHENNIFCLLAARDGSLWIGTEGGGVVRYLHGQFSNWTTQDNVTNDFVRALAQDADGTIWVGTDNRLMRLSGNRFVRVDGTASIPALSLHAIYRDHTGRLWLGGWRLFQLLGKTAVEYSLGRGSSQNQVKSITETRDGTIWVGTVSGLNRLRPGATRFERFAGISGTVRALRETPDGVLWIGTIGQGAFEFSGNKLTHITAPASLPSNTVLNFFEDGEKNFWIGAQTGMVRLTRTPVNVIPLPQANDSDFGTISQDRDGSFWIGSTRLFHMSNGGIKSEQLPGIAGVHVRNVYRDRAGTLWVGTDGSGVFHIAAGRTTRLTSSNGLSNNFVRAIAQDRDRSMWIATDGGLNHILGEEPNLRIVSYQAPYPSNRALLEDRQGDLWIGTDRGLGHMRNGAFLTDAATAAMAQMKVWAIHEDTDGGIWFGTRNNGLFRLRDGQVAHYTTEDGLAGNAIYQIVEDGAGHFWMSGPNGISLLNRHELDAQANLSARHLALTFYSIADMAANTEIYGGTQSSGCITAAGDVWFPSSYGPIHIQPIQRTQMQLPPLNIRSVLVDGQPASLAAPIVLGPGNNRLEFAYAPIRLRSQDGLRFRYRMDGFDKDWSAVTLARTADYTNLPPGRYSFRVRTFEIGNPDAASEAVIEIVKQPYFYKTWWFIAACVLLVALTIFAAYQYRVRQVRSRFEAVLGERSRMAHEMHDTVIQGCTGVSALLEALSMKDARDETGGGLMDFARQQLRSTINEAREAIWNLRQENDNDDNLVEKMESMAAQLSAEFHVPIACATAGAPFGLGHPLAHDLLMVAREAVFNAVLHGSPTRVEVTLGYDRRELTLSVFDDGCGFDQRAMESKNSHHFGLKGMRERVERWGGKFRLTSAVGKGVRIDVRMAKNR